MTALDRTTSAYVELPLHLRHTAGRLADGPGREALVDLAGELEAGGDPALISHAALRAALEAYGSLGRPPDIDDRMRRVKVTNNSVAKPAHIIVPPILRRAADRRPPGPNRDALLRYADELEATGDATLVSHTTVGAVLRALRNEKDDSGVTKPEHMSRAASLRGEADCYPDGPDRDALLRYADELEKTGDAALISKNTVRAALKAFASPDRPPDLVSLICNYPEPDGQEPDHVRMPPILRGEADRRPPGPNRDALLRYADELEATGDATLVSRATSRAAIDAFGADDDSAEAGRDADALQ